MSLEDGIGAVLSEAFGTETTVDVLRRLTGGASRQVWAAETHSADGRSQEVVLRRDPPGHGDADRMQSEVACLQAAAAAGVPVPAVLASGSSAPGIDAPYLLMDMVTGESIPRKLQRDPELQDVRTHLADDMGYVLGRIHSAKIDGLGMLDCGDPLSALEAVYRSMDEPRPAVEAGLRWLQENRPTKRPDALVHGDFRLGNVLVDNTGIRGVLDWELAHLGDPIEDLGWLCVRAWRFGAEPPVGGIGTRDQLLDGYERATGIRPSSDELHWWECYGTLRWLVLSQFQSQRHLSGAENSIELAAIGRRVCESEYDLFLILGLLDDIEPLPDITAPSLHDRPSLSEIIGLVRGTLRDDVAPVLDGTHDRARYLLRICANLLDIAEREIGAADSSGVVRSALAALGCESEAELADRICSGTLMYANPDVRHAISAAILARLRVSNPRHLLLRATV
ncbi:phosphotransferase family protein [Rhodococcus sp. C26F]